MLMKCVDEGFQVGHVSGIGLKEFYISLIVLNNSQGLWGLLVTKLGVYIQIQANF